MHHSSPKPLDQARQLTCTRHYSTRTDKILISWIRLFIFFYGKRLPEINEADHILAFISCLTNGRQGSVSSKSRA